MVDEHRSNFLSVKIAMTALQRSLNCDMLLAARTAPGHSYRNPVKKVNCVLNLRLYGIGIMWQQVYDVPDFERNLRSCGNTDDVRRLLSQNTKYKDLLNRSCEPCISLIKSNFESLYLKESTEVLKNTTEDETKDIFNTWYIQ